MSGEQSRAPEYASQTVLKLRIFRAYPVTRGVIRKARAVMSDNDDATITISSGDRRLVFAWRDYDGDDSFQSHTVEYKDAAKHVLHDYKGCAIRSVRLLTEMLNRKHGDKGFGFRVPEIVYYDIKIADGVFLYHAHSDELALDFNVQLSEFETFLALGPWQW